MTREESRAMTQARPLAAAHDLFGREGDAATSVDLIAKAAGCSKEAVHPNFDGEEAISLAVLEAQGRVGLDGVQERIDCPQAENGLLDPLAEWAGDRSRSGAWSPTILGHARTTPSGSAFLIRHEENVREHWRRLGTSMLLHLREPSATDAESPGALPCKIADAPVMTFVQRPRAEDVMRLVMSAPLHRGGKR